MLRSFGKFFGLAGVRLGFVLAERHLLQLLAEQLGPWTISGPTRVLGQACLLDSVAHQQQIVRCAAASQRLAGVLSAAGFAPHGSCDLFQYLVTDQAAQLHEFMARRGILLRLFTQPPSLRFGLPASEQDFQRLALAFSEYRKEQP
ncbi:threonine-phosphate decarboxylase [compost metagenome]